VNRRPQQRVGSRWFQVDELRLGTERYLAWEEATEREYSTELPVGRLPHGGVRAEVHVPAGVEAERLGEDALLERSWRQLDGELVVAATPQAAGVVRLSATFANRCRARVSDRSEALRRSFLSAHMIARCPAGEFVSCTAPPSDLAEPAASCENDGLWPVLVGRDGTLDTVLGSPIILSDHPSVAPESPGDLFDGGEIDVLLIHSIRALTDAEREEMRATDPRTREILERSVALAPEQLQQLYGAVREMRRVES
jgi:hypothetical protein